MRELRSAPPWRGHLAPLQAADICLGIALRRVAHERVPVMVEIVLSTVATRVAMAAGVATGPRMPPSRVRACSVALLAHPEHCSAAEKGES